MKFMETIFSWPINDLVNGDLYVKKVCRVLYL